MVDEHVYLDRTHVVLFWHERGLTEEDAVRIREELGKVHIPATIKPHKNPNPPDAIFIGALVRAEEARTVLAKVPYKVEYIFPLEYPRGQGGDPDGFLIGLGYHSTHAQDKRTKESTPIRVSEAEFSSLLEVGLSNTIFQVRLRTLLARG